MKKRKKKAGGMTLVEIVVAMAIFAIISALLVSASAGICYIVRKTDRLNKKITNEAPAAEVRNNTSCQIPTDSAGNDIESDMILSVGGKNYSVSGNEYVATDDEGNYEEGGNFRYFEGNSVAEVP
jgi:prepilin-type N-terminal cleavage/methylation domain-containing protein